MLFLGLAVSLPSAWSVAVADDAPADGKAETKKEKKTKKAKKADKSDKADKDDKDGEKKAE
jgi:hypothetical protein